MKKLRAEDLELIAEKAKGVMLLREGAGRAKVVVHMGTCGIAAGARKVMSALMAEVEKSDVTDVLLTTSSCAGLCSREPIITVEIQGELPVKYCDLTPEKAARIFEEHLLGGKIVNEFVLAAGRETLA